MLPKKSVYRRDFDINKYMPFLIKNEETYNEICDKVSNTIEKGFDSDPVYNEKYLKPKTKSSEGKISKNFYGNKMPKEGSQCICLSVILIYADFGTDKNYYPQVF